MTKMNKKVLILILNYNGADYVRDCFSSLEDIKYPRENYQILVVDNNSTDNSIELIKNNWPEIKIIKNQKNIGFAAGNNIGMQYGIDNNFDYIYLLNQDTAVEPDFLQKAIEVGEYNEKIGAVQSKLLLFKAKSKINSIGNELHFLGFGFAGGYQMSDYEINSKEITYSSGACFLLKTKVLKEVGLFQEEFFAYHEDTDLSWRIWLAGYKLMLAPNSVVYHKYEFSRSIKKFYYMERNRYLIILQNYKLATILLISPACISMSLAMFFYSFIAGWYKENLRVYFYFLKPSTWSKIKKARKKIQSSRKVSDKFFTRKLVGKIEFQDVQNPLLKYIANPIFNLYWQLVRKIIFW